MPITLSMVDLQNGAGATATIAGSDGGITNTVFTSPMASYAPTPVAPSWTSQGTRLGDGTLTIPGLGYYFAYCQGKVAGVTSYSPPVFYLGSSNADAVLTRCMNAIAGRIQTLTLTGLNTPPGTLPAGQVYVKPAINLNLYEVVLPAIFVTPGGVESVEGMVSGLDDIGYPVAVTIVDNWSPSYSPPAPTYYKWREQLFRGLRFQRLAGVDEVFTVRPEPRAIVEWKAIEYNKFYTGILFRCISREGRGA